MGRLIDKRDLPIFIHSKIDDLGLTPRAFRLYGHLARRANPSGTAWPSYAEMGQICFASEFTSRDRPVNKDTTRRWAIEAMKELVAYGLVRKKARYQAAGDQTSNDYELTPQSEWITEGVVMGGHHGSDGGSLGVVTPDHYGSDGGSPKDTPLEDTPLEDTPTTYFLAAQPPKNGGHDAADHAGTTDQPVQEHELPGGSDCPSGSDDRDASAARGVSDGPDRGSEAAPGGSPRALTLNERFALEAEADRKREAALRRVEEARNAGKQHDEDGDPVVQHEFALLIARACRAGSLTKDQLRKLNAPMQINNNNRLVEGPSLIQMWDDSHWHSGLKTHFEETVKTMRKQLGKTPDRTRLVSAMRNYEPHGKVGTHAANQVGGRSAPAKPKLTGKYDWFDGDTIQD